MDLRPRVAGDLAAGASRIAPLLAAHPIEHHVFATALARLRDDPPGAAAATLAWIEDAGGAAVGAALDAPPYPLVVSILPFGGEEPLSRALLERGVEPPGIAGPEPSAARTAAAWAAARGRRVTATMAHLVEVLDHLEPAAAPPAGHARLGEETDCALVAQWLVAFGLDVGLPVPDAAGQAELRLGSRSLLLWEHEGPACLVGWSRRELGIVRIAPVYTPPGRRGRGYATAAVAAASARLLAAGVDQLMLLADRDDPTARGVYRRVGYRPVGEAGYHALA